MKHGNLYVLRTIGAAFILYNSARLESLLRRFDEKVENGDYEGLPPLDSINFTLLDEEVSECYFEWCLFLCSINIGRSY